jgi:hypothetical protein
LYYDGNLSDAFYSYKICAKKANKTAYSSVKTIDLRPVNAPSNFKVVANIIRVSTGASAKSVHVGDDDIHFDTKKEFTFSWTDTADNEKGYEIQFFIDNTKWKFLKKVGANKICFSVVWTHSNNVRFRIRSYNDYHYSSWVSAQLSNSNNKAPVVMKSNMIPSAHIEKVGINNYPNPFNPETNIIYYVPTSGRVSVKIYNLRGKLVKKLYVGYKGKGNYIVHWNGKNENGHEVASGIYYCVITQQNYRRVKKMVLLK